MDPITALGILGTLISGVLQLAGAVDAGRDHKIQAAVHREVELYRRLPPKSGPRMNAKIAALELSWRLPARQALLAKPMLSAQTQWQRDLSDALFDREFDQ